MRIVQFGRGITGQAAVSHLVRFQVQFVDDQEQKDATREIVQKYQTILRRKRKIVAYLIANLLVSVCKIIILVMDRITVELSLMQAKSLKVLLQFRSVSNSAKTTNMQRYNIGRLNSERTQILILRGLKLRRFDQNQGNHPFEII